MSKKCISCDEDKQLDQFERDNHKVRLKSGEIKIYQRIRTKCKICRNLQNKNRKNKNKPLHRKKANEYYRLNKSKFRERAYRKKNIIPLLIKTCSRHDKEKNRECNIDVNYISTLLTEQQNKCHYCNHEVMLEKGDRKMSQISIDRIDNSKGHIKGNCIITCLFCNMARNDVPIDLYKLFISTLKGKTQVNLNNFVEDKTLVSKLRHCCRDMDKIRKRDITETITSEEIKKLLVKQNYKCAVTGLTFINLNIPKYPFKMSVDRIDNNKGHSTDNCQLVCIAIQNGRRKIDNDSVIKYINEIKALT